MNNTVVFTAPGNVEIQDREIPVPQSGEVLIQTQISLISTGTELTFLSGVCPENSKWSTYIHYPMTSGYSNVGRIIDVGEGVNRNWIGKQVASFCNHAQFVISKESELRPINYDIPPELASFFAVAEVGINGIRRTKIELGNRVVVYGAGIIGQLLVRFLLAGGCTEIVVVDTAEERLRHLPETPAIIPVNPLKESVLDVVKKVTQEKLADIVFESTGNAQLIPQEFQVLHQQGKLCMLSSPREKTLFDFHDLCNAGSIQIIGAHISAQAPVETYDNPWTCTRNSETFFRMLYNKQIDLSNLITSYTSYHEAPTQYELLLKDRTQAMGVIFDWNK